MYKVSVLNSIDYGATGNDAILQNVSFIISTVKNTCVLDRNFGCSQDMVDEPIPFAQSQYTANIIEAIETFEPRVRVEEVLFDTEPLTGKLIPTVKVVLADGEI